MITVQIASDLHIDYNFNGLYLDFRKYIEIPSKNNDENVDILILPGDIGCLYKIEQLKNFLSSIYKNYKYIIYVYGNNEFYFHSKVKLPFEKILEKGKYLESVIPNLYILNQNSLVIEDYVFVGCTLWSNIKQTNKSYFKIEGFSNEIYFRKHIEDLNYIKESINFFKDENKKIIVVTHYPPIFNIENSESNIYFNNLYDFIYNSNIHSWIHGHNHLSRVYKVGETNVISNQKGKKQNPNNNYNTKFIIKI